jgi:hypothetical protein
MVNIGYVCFNRGSMKIQLYFTDRAKKPHPATKKSGAGRGNRGGRRREPSPPPDKAVFTWAVKELGTKPATRRTRSSAPTDDSPSTRPSPSRATAASTSRGRGPSTSRATADNAASTSRGRRGRRPGDGIGKHKSENYKHDIEFRCFKDYSFPSGKPPKNREERGREANARMHVEEVAQLVVEDMYVHLTDGLIVPENSPVDYLGDYKIMLLNLLICIH